MSDQSTTKFLGLWVTSVYFKILSCSGIRQGSKALYQNQPIQGRYDRGHLVPVNILSYSHKSARDTFIYTNCVPQIAGFNRGQWNKYERKIKIYARKTCSQNGGTLYLITGTSKVKFVWTLYGQGQITGSEEPLQWFHNNADVNDRIAIPNSMWTVGCCLNSNDEVVGAFGVMGDNSINKKRLNKFMMSRQTVADVESALKSEDPTIKLFPKGKDCYLPQKNVKLNETHR